jgi:putative transcriptional regulator
MMRESYIGQLLVASSTVTDPMFANGVCLIVHDDETRVIGVMLNRPIEPNSEAFETILGETDSKQPEPSQPRFSVETTKLTKSEGGPPLPNPDLPIASRSLHFGGPLSGPIVALHQIRDYAEAETGEGIFVAAQKHHLVDLIRDQDEPCRLIVGHLGWDPEELDAEISNGTWHVIPASVDDVFSSANDMWPSIIRRATNSSLAKWIGLPDANAAGELN